MAERDVSLQLIDPQRPASHADVENCYRLFLARGALAQIDVTEKAGLPLLPIIVSLLTSDEFDGKIGLAGDRLAVDERMLTRLEPDLLDWLALIATPVVGRDDAAPDRLGVIVRLLDSDGIWPAFKNENSRNSDALKAAFARSESEAEIVATSVLFDPLQYLAQVPADQHIARPAMHYVLLGEPRGLAPSVKFDATGYADRNADIAASSINRLYHYEVCGRQEGRLHRDWLLDHAMPPLNTDGSRPTILLLLHDAAYTGAPILGWNLARALADTCDVVVVLRHGGALEPALAEVAAALVPAPPPGIVADADEMTRFAARLTALYAPCYAIANSVESYPLAAAVRRQAVPVVGLVHEFWPGATPAVRLEFYAACSALVFPARIVEQSSLDAFREARLQNRFVLPQGPCAVPPFDPAAAPRPFGAPFVAEEDRPVSLETLLADGTRGTGPFTVIGLGAVEMRKGLDLFIAAATAMQARYPDIACRFIWIGTWEHAIGSPYAALLAEQSKRAALGDRLHFFPAVDDLEPVYARADALFLSSRLDPLPNITIDAAVRGIPVICFAAASGTAELMAANPGTATLVVPHLDSGAAADRIAMLARDAGLRQSAGEAMQQLARRSFDMHNYALALDQIGQAAARKAANAILDAQLIEQADALDAALYFGPDRADLPATAHSAAIYIDETSHLNFASPPVFGAIQRRPRPGFHPFIYGMEAPDFPRDGSRDPLAHFVERGMPEGRWTHRVLRPDLIPAADAAADGDGDGVGRIALHGHFHYPDTIGDLMTALGANRLRADLFLTTTSEVTAERLRAASSDYAGGDVLVEVGPNVGRDIHAFLEVLRTHLHGRYDLVGHVHGKRSVHAQGADPSFGERWRRFLWEHLLGPSNAAADAIVAAFARDPALGLVFPENGYLVGWEKNEASAAALARRIGLRRSLPGYIEFPAGTMFWARVVALEALVRADLRTDEMPPEPVAIDGTMLHAFERMLPLLCEEAGYGYATSYIPHLGR